jgi:hypothetical protein
MVKITAQSAGLRRLIVSIPSQPFIVALEILKKLGINILDPNVLRRFGEDVNIPTDKMRDFLAITPRRFESGIIAAIKDWQREAAI